MFRFAVRKLALIAFTVSALVTNVAIAQSPKIDPSWPDWLKEAMAKEHETLRFEPLSLGPIKTVMPGKITEKQETEPGQYYAAADDGSGAPFECWFFSDPMDMATSTVNTADAIIDALSKQYGPVGVRNVHHVDAGAIDGSSFLALEWLYTVGEAPDALVGLTKVRTAERDGMHVICAHSLPGYRESFANAFAELVRELDTEAELAEPYYEELHVLNLNDLNLGFSKVSMTLDEDGDTRIDTTEAMLIPVSATEISTTDGTAVSWSTPDGYLIKSVESSAENGDLAMNLSLWIDDEDTWVVDGSLSGKAINEQLGKEARPVSALGEMRAVRNLMQEPETTSTDLMSWIPDADPTVFSNVAVTLDPESNTKGAATITMGPLKINGEFDESGSMRRGTMDVGGVTIAIERVFVAGGLR